MPKFPRQMHSRAFSVTAIVTRQLHTTIVTLALCFATPPAAASESNAPEKVAIQDPAPRMPETKKTDHWYDHINLRGYVQFRYNRAFESNADFRNDQGDKSIGGDGGFFIRRARLILFGDIHPQVYFYFQPDFGASPIADTENFAQLRDFYTDVAFDKKKEFRVRIGQSKVPYGFENLQSSQNRIVLDRSDSLNTAFVNERDLGVHFMFAPDRVRKVFADLVQSGLKGSGDYGMVSVGVVSGQPLNKPEKNLSKHFVARVSYPFNIGSQTMELGFGGYTGLFQVKTDKDKDVAVTSERPDMRDFRVHASAILYPKPFGLQAEWNTGRGPERVGNVVRERPLSGGYVMAMARFETPVGWMLPYARVHYYDGGKKFETNAPRHEVLETNIGLEWQPYKALEIVTEFMAGRRTVNGKEQEGRLLRFQVQLNY